MARMRFKNAYNYDSAARQVDTGDFDFILDQDTDIGKAFYDVVLEAITIGMVDFIEIFEAENDLLTQAEADALYELIGAVAAHVAALDPHPQYTTAAELAAGLATVDLSAYSTTAQSALLYEAIGAAAAAIVAHNAALDPHPGYLTPAEGNAAYDAIGAATAAVSAHEGAANPHPTYTTDAEVTAAISAALGAAAFARTTTVITTASLADNAVENSTVTLAAGYKLLGIQVDRACRVRLYTTSALRTADAARLVGVDVDTATDHGLMFEYIAEAAVDVQLSPLVDGACPTGTTVYYAIQNLSGGTSTVAVTLDWIRTE